MRAAEPLLLSLALRASSPFVLLFLLSSGSELTLAADSSLAAAPMLPTYPILPDDARILIAC
jgi:hypothetical protein